jgi:hypothetical protein
MKLLPSLDQSHERRVRDIYFRFPAFAYQVIFKSVKQIIVNLDEMRLEVASRPQFKLAQQTDSPLTIYRNVEKLLQAKPLNHYDTIEDLQPKSCVQDILPWRLHHLRIHFLHEVLERLTSKSEICKTFWVKNLKLGPCVKPIKASSPVRAVVEPEHLL